MENMKRMPIVLDTSINSPTFLPRYRNMCSETQLKIELSNNTCEK